MKLTKKKAIEISIELWEWLEETGDTKLGWPGWDKYGQMECECALCEYCWRRSKKGTFFCSPCPLEKKYPDGGCMNTAFGDWDSAFGGKARKKYAKLFLAQLKEL